ncbi:hypothetical protein JX266_012748 [Neoarthrinium moseri]|nr:hypothetical protein JX266_012748 [Neoarthrinium moseri]
MLRRLNAIGREFAIQHELEQLPSNIRDVYKILLEDCQKARNPKDKAVLKKLFAWLAYSKEPLSLGSAGKLLRFIAKDCEISIDDELEHHCARILRLSNAATDEDQHDDSSDDLELGDDDTKSAGDDESTAEDMNVFLGFQERSLRHYFRERNDAVDGLQSSGSIGNMLVFHIIDAILTRDGKKTNDNEDQDDVTAYAARHWLSHLTDIDANELNDDEAASVVEALCSILSNRNGAVREMELEQFGASVGIKESCVLGTSATDRDSALKVLQTWARRAIQLPPAVLSPLALTWIKPLVRDAKTIYVKLADAHVSNWLTTPDVRFNYQAGCSFGYAHNALRLGQELQSMKGNEKLREYFDKLDEECTITEESILLVSEAFLHIDKTAQSYRSIGMALENERMHEEALKQFRIGLDISVSPSDMIYLYYEMGEVLLNLADEADEAETDGTAEEKDQKGGESVVEHTEKSDATQPQDPSQILVNGVSNGEGSLGSLQSDGDAVAAVAKKEPSPPKKTQREWAAEASALLATAASLDITLSENAGEQLIVRSSLMNVWMMRARSEILLDDSSNTVRYMANSISARPKDEAPYCYNIINALDKRGEFEKIVEVFRLYPKEVRIMPLLSCEMELQKACKFTGQVDLLCQAYVEAMQKHESWADYFRPKLAQLLKTVRGVDGYAEAKDLLQRSLTSSFSWMIPQASFQLSDILVEEFRNTKDPARKFEAFKEMERLVTTVKESMGNEFDPTQSQTTIPFALMTRQIKPLRFQEILQATFQGCLVALRDEIAGNDSVSFRTLAKVLACVPGLQTEASIAATCQLYVVDMATYKKEQRDSVSEGKPDSSGESKGPSEQENLQVSCLPNGEDAAVTAESASTQDNAGVDAQEPVGDTEAIPPPNPEAKELSREEQDSEEDLDSSASIQCGECSSWFSNWKDKPVYLCYYCTELTLCEKCYTEKINKENGKLPEPWRTLCPAGHKHIKAPAEGWNGVKDGVLRIGTSEIAFRAWLAELEAKKWPAAWDRFWSESSV